MMLKLTYWIVPGVEKPDSRLSCHVKLDHEDLEIEIPKYTINHASENH